MTSNPAPTRWIWRIVAGLTLVFGWFFILFHNRFNVTVPVVVIGLGYFAAVATLFNLWRVGAAAVAPEDATREAWSRPYGARGDLEKEKRTLLRSIKEAEFDQLMGKLSKVDADELIRMYRARAIEVIKELDRMDAGEGGSARAQIEREVGARLALEADAKRSRKKDKKGKGKGKSESKEKVVEKVGAKDEEKDEEKAKDEQDEDSDEQDDEKPAAEAASTADEPPPEAEAKSEAKEATS